MLYAFATEQVRACSRVADPPARATSPHRASCLALERLARDGPLTFPARSWGRFPLYSRPDGRNGFGTRATDLNKISLSRSTRFVVASTTQTFLQTPNACNRAVRLFASSVEDLLYRSLKGKKGNSLTCRVYPLPISPSPFVRVHYVVYTAVCT